MSNNRTVAFSAEPRVRSVARVPQWPFSLSREERLLDGLWIAFMVGATTAFYHPATLFGIIGAERLFWLPTYLAVFIAFFPRQRQFFLLAQKNAIFLTWPLLACVSAIWSFAPAISFYHGIQLLMTIMIGFLLFVHADLLRVLQILFSAMLVCSILSVAYVIVMPGQAISVFGEWQGAFGHKNTLGNLMALQIVTGVCLFWHGWRPLFSGGSVALAILLLAFSRSATALVALIATLAAVPPALAFRSGVKSFLVVLVTVSCVATVVAFVVIESDVNVITSILEALGKDATLSSRTLLWDFAMDAIQERPWLGFGFKGYWNTWETPMAMLRFEIGQDLWFFHNVFLETAVAFGIMGPLLLAAGLIYALIIGLRLIAVSRGPIWLWPFLFTVFTTVQCFAEYPIFVNHSLSQSLLAAVLATQWRDWILSPARRSVRPSG